MVFKIAEVRVQLQVGILLTSAMKSSRVENEWDLKLHHV